MRTSNKPKNIKTCPELNTFYKCAATESLVHQRLNIRNSITKQKDSAKYPESKSTSFM